MGPDQFIERYGADACRLNILFLGPADEDMEWTETSVEGMAHFVRRLWRVVNEVAALAPLDGPEGGGPLATVLTPRSPRSPTTSVAGSRSTRRSRR